MASPADILPYLDLAAVDKPTVSIIVCAHNHLETTVACLQAIDQTHRWNETSCEVVLVDDASTDATPALQEVRGLRYLRLTSNRGFLRAANAGVAAARGEHILFLNNDTLPQGTWLDELVDTLARRPRAGVVGARLVFPDGRVQEAGGIIFNDGHGWNYGRLGAFDDPRVTFERPVDYCSGAALLVRGDLMRLLGGFDERFAPAYYEDADLCFAARAQGFEVWYQPDAIVVHREGTSHGTDETTGQKAHQVHNRQVFFEKWADTLREQAAPLATSVELASRRSTTGHILVFDHEVPTPDRDAGSHRLIAILEAMIELGYGVTYAPLNGWRRPPYTRLLERLGVEVIGHLAAQWPQVLAVASKLTHAWVARPHVAETILPRLRAELPHLRLIYDTVDLHFLREEREAALSDDPALTARAAQTRQLELSIAEAVDAVVVVSPFERDTLRAHTPTPVYVVPTIHEIRGFHQTPPTNHDVLFVGGFLHPPNVDAVSWLVQEIAPAIRQTVPTARVLVVGSNMPDRIRRLACDGVELLGWVPDLRSLYEQVRVVVAPLRYGAGVKGKVGEALGLGLPVVLTSLAAEGMHIQHDVHALIADDVPTFADHVCRLLREDALWQLLSDRGRHLATTHFSPTAVRPRVKAALCGTLPEVA